jgi:hypothetical protein
VIPIDEHGYNKERGFKSNPMRQRSPASGMMWLLGASAAALLLAGCGDFWQNPAGTSTGGTATTTTLTATPTSVAAGGNVALTATVTPAAATGSVSFYNNGTEIGIGDLSSGTASYTATFSTAGTESVTATYGGDSTYASSTSAAVTVTVTAAAADAFRPANTSRKTNLVLDPANDWTLSANSSLHNVAGVALSDGEVENIDGGDHCLYYSGTLYFTGGTSDAKGVYPLSGGGYLAPEGTAGLDCN